MFALTTNETSSAADISSGSSRVKEPKWWQLTSEFAGSILQRAFFLVEYLMKYKSLVGRIQSFGAQSKNLLRLMTPPVKCSTGLTFQLYLIAWSRRSTTAFLLQLFPKSYQRRRWFTQPSGTLLPTQKCRRVFCCTKDRTSSIAEFYKLLSFKECNRASPLAYCILDSLAANLYSPEAQCGRSPLEKALYYVHIHKWLSVVSNFGT